MWPWLLLSLCSGPSVVSPSAHTQGCCAIEVPPTSGRLTAQRCAAGLLAARRFWAPPPSRSDGGRTERERRRVWSWGGWSRRGAGARSVLEDSALRIPRCPRGGIPSAVLCAPALPAAEISNAHRERRALEREEPKNCTAEVLSFVLGVLYGKHTEAEVPRSAAAAFPRSGFPSVAICQRRARLCDGAALPVGVPSPCGTGARCRLTLNASASPHGARRAKCGPALGRRTRRTLPCCSDVTQGALNAAPRGRA